jgi:hypothetical protein
VLIQVTRITVIKGLLDPIATFLLGGYYIFQNSTLGTERFALLFQYYVSI